MIIVYGIIVLIGIFACYVWWKICIYAKNKAIAFINRKEIKENSNPYILAQKIIYDNDRKYEEYLSWMSFNGEGGVPLDKIMTEEEFIAEQKIKSAIKK